MLPNKKREREKKSRQKTEVPIVVSRKMKTPIFKRYLFFEDERRKEREKKRTNKKKTLRGNFYCCLLYICCNLFVKFLLFFFEKKINKMKFQIFVFEIFIGNKNIK